MGFPERTPRDLVMRQAPYGYFTTRGRESAQQRGCESLQQGATWLLTLTLEQAMPPCICFCALKRLSTPKPQLGAQRHTLPYMHGLMMSLSCRRGSGKGLKLG